MNEQQMRRLLQEIIEDVDSGRVEIRQPRTLRLTGTLAAAAAALGLAACGAPAKKSTQAPADSRPKTAQVDAAAPKTPPARKPMVDPGPQPEYAAPATPPTTRPEPRKKPRVDPGAQADYAAPPIPRTMQPKRRRKPIDNGGNTPLYGVP